MTYYNPVSRAYMVAGISAAIALGAIASLAFTLAAHRNMPAATSDVVIHGTSGAPPSYDAIRAAMKANGRKAVDKAMADITLVPRKIELTSEFGKDAREAIKRGDYATASKIAHDIFKQSKLRAWDFQPLRA